MTNEEINKAVKELDTDVLELLVAYDRALADAKWELEHGLSHIRMQTARMEADEEFGIGGLILDAFDNEVRRLEKVLNAQYPVKGSMVRLGYGCAPLFGMMELTDRGVRR